jgi:hypothetical protein
VPNDPATFLYLASLATATAGFDAAAGEAVVNFTASAELSLESYRLRGVPGPEYDGEDEVVLARLDKKAPAPSAAPSPSPNPARQSPSKSMS